MDGNKNKKKICGKQESEEGQNRVTRFVIVNLYLGFCFSKRDIYITDL